MLGAVATVLMLFEIPLWFAPGFYKLDFSEVVVLIGGFALGPVAGIMIELVKVLLNLIINGTETAGIGEMANFIIGCSLIVPASVIYLKHKDRKHAIIGMIIGTLCMATVGSLLNAYLLLPVYAKAFNMPIDALVAIGTAVNPSINSLSDFVLMAVAPFNILKGAVTGLITIAIYKKLSPIIKGRC
jgi:riboflavin transporter FmnP